MKDNKIYVCGADENFGFDEFAIFARVIEKMGHKVKLARANQLGNKRISDAVLDESEFNIYYREFKNPPNRIRSTLG